MWPLTSIYSPANQKQLLSQVMKLSYFPHIKVYHTSKKFYGQVYIPLANWLMMVGTIIVTAVYHNVRLHPNYCIHLPY